MRKFSCIDPEQDIDIALGDSAGNRRRPNVMEFGSRQQPGKLRRHLGEVLTQLGRQFICSDETHGVFLGY
jgi:hypothetical protein